MLYTLAFSDPRERRHVAVVDADTPEEAFKLVEAYQLQFADQAFHWPYPTVENVQEMPVVEKGEVAILFHEDYD